MDVISSYRAMAYLKHFKKYGYEPTLLTHHWGEDVARKDVSIEEFDYGSIIRVPIIHHKRTMFFKFLEKIKFLNKVAILIRWLLGYLDTTPQQMDSYYSLKEYCSSTLDLTKYHVMIGIFSPHHHLKLCYELNKKFGTPYILDFRDLWNNRLVYQYYKPATVQLLQDKINKFYWKKWLLNSMFFTSVSQKIVDIIEDLSGIEGYLITNGFDEEAFKVIEPPISKVDKFVILYAGTIYEHQALDVFFEGCKLFIEKCRPSKFKIKFTGSDREGAIKNQSSGYKYEARNYLESQLDKKYIEVTKRIPKQELIEEIFQSQLLLFPAMPDYPGLPLGKIFDYLASGKNVLLTPDDNDMVGEILRLTGVGVICKDKNELATKLEELYKIWQIESLIPYNGIKKEINKYSREYQTKLISEHLNKYLD